MVDSDRSQTTIQHDEEKIRCACLMTKARIDTQDKLEQISEK